MHQLLYKETWHIQFDWLNQDGRLITHGVFMNDLLWNMLHQDFNFMDCYYIKVSFFIEKMILFFKEGYILWIILCDFFVGIFPGNRYNSKLKFIIMIIIGWLCRNIEFQNSINIRQHGFDLNLILYRWYHSELQFVDLLKVNDELFKCRGSQV